MRKITRYLLATCFFTASCNNDCPKDPKNLNYNGCGDFIVYDDFKNTGLSNAYISVNVKKEMLNLTTSTKIFDLATNPHFEVKIAHYDRPADLYCTDVVLPEFPVQINRWEAISGNASVTIIRPANECTDTYVVDVVLTNVVFQDNSAQSLELSYKYFKNVFVGYYVP